MPVIRNTDGSLGVASEFPKVFDDRREFVTATGNATAAFTTCEALAQLPEHADKEVPPENVFAFYGDSDTVTAFALLGWLRGRELSIIDGVVPKVENTDRYLKPRKVRVLKVHHGTVTEGGRPVIFKVAGATPKAPVGAEKPAPRVWCAPQYVVVTKGILPKISPELRAVLKTIHDTLWVGRTVTELQRLLARTPGGRSFQGELLRLCWVPQDKVPSEDEGIAI